MTKLNIRQGDIPETDEEVEKELTRLAKQDARREAQRRGRLAEKKAQEAAKEPVVTKKFQAKLDTLLIDHEPGQPLPEDAAERAASGSGYQGEEVEDVQVYHGTERIVKEKPAPRKAAPKDSAKHERQLALVTPKAEKPSTKKTARTKVEKPVKEPKATTPKAPHTEEGWRLSPIPHAKPTNKNGYAYLTPELVVLVFEDKDSGMKNAEIAERRNISPSSVGTILSGPAWFKTRMTRYGGANWTYPVKAPKPVEKTPEHEA